jgi:hypothetical protein
MNARCHPVEAWVTLALALALAASAGVRLLEGPLPRHPVATGRLMAALDVDGDQRLSGPELAGREPPGAPWTRHDLDGDGAINLRELEVAMEDVDPRWLLSEGGR